VNKDKNKFITQSQLRIMTERNRTKHVDILKQGVAVWNDWNKKHPTTIPQLQHTDLRGCVLRGVKLQRADLTGANLQRVNLRAARLQNAILRSANLRSADMRGADLTGADLSDCDLRQVILVDTNLSSAKLNNAFVYGIAAWKYLGTHPFFGLPSSSRAILAVFQH